MCRYLSCYSARVKLPANLTICHGGTVLWNPREIGFNSSHARSVLIFLFVYFSLRLLWICVGTDDTSKDLSICEYREM